MSDWRSVTHSDEVRGNVRVHDLRQHEESVVLARRELADQSSKEEHLKFNICHLPSFLSFLYLEFGLEFISALNLTLMKSVNKGLLLTVDNHGDV
ncbi:hypothetical protein ALC60_00791 [Trachymyrmex zeteki]|uniref:Uncharacterized protein n=1 Tax=Mycetomoellerius zeteki TaxID=64791 RepID=A0A151XIZ4_9HYME|nr:hypothetical protein ALC60_00791 [Trachymyrmex zeteki]